MNILEHAIKVDFEAEETITLLNAVMYKLAIKTGHQLAIARTLNFIDGAYSPTEAPNIAPSQVEWMNQLANHVNNLLYKRYSAEYERVNSDVIITHYILKRGEEYTTYIGMRVWVNAGEKALLNYHVDFAELEDGFIPVDIARLPTPDSATCDEPICYLNMATIKDLCQVDEIDSEVLESVSMAAEALGWSDTEMWGKTMILIG